ncbi:MAG: ATP-dependent helicase [Planctomycetota bacterium]|nr:ATP-dependent helicase [Planctomycetota bacterium]
MEQLDASQRAFCQAPSVNLRLLAPAGCGKTLSLLFRCKHLAEQSDGHRPRFLIVTFTRSARDELLARVNEDSRFACIRDIVEITTLNSWGFRRIKNVAFSPKLISSKTDCHFAMLNQLQSVWMKYPQVRAAIEGQRNIVPRSLMNVMDAYKSIGFDHTRHKNYEQFAQRGEELRSQGLSWKLDALVADLTKLGILGSKTSRKGQEVAQAGDREVYNAFFKFWREAADHLINNATFTLEDQKYYAYLDERQKVEEGKLLSGAARYDHVLVDEFQDINPLDLALIKAITERSRATVTIVGDDDQAIFEWRGTTPEYILSPDQFFDSPFLTHTLATNYRSPKNIVELSQRLIACNTRRVAKATRAFRSEKAEIEIEKVASLTEALDRVYSEVEQAIGKGESPSRVALIGRKRSQIIPYQVFFASKDVPFCAAEDLQVFMSETFERLLRLLIMKERARTGLSRFKIVEDLLELCGLVKRYPLNRTERAALKRYLQQCGPSTMAAAVEVLAGYAGPLKGRNSNGNTSLCMAEAVAEFLGASTVSDALTKLGTHFEGLQLDMGRAADDIFYVDPPFFHLAEYASRYGNDYAHFVEDIEHAKEQLAYVPPFEDDGEAATPEELWRRPLHLMTALRAKGKEFDSVILLDVNEGIWPNRNARSQEQREAERRVFYVAFTRARKKVLMLVNTHLSSREAVVSPFVEELGLAADCPAEAVAGACP